MPNTQKFCTECTFCSWKRIDADGPQWPCCNNPGMKLYLLPERARACELFKARPTIDDHRTIVSTIQLKATEIAKQSDRHPSSVKWKIVGKSVELLAMGIAGAGASNLDKREGILAFACGLSVAVIVLVGRIINR